MEELGALPAQPTEVVQPAERPAEPQVGLQPAEVQTAEAMETAMETGCLPHHPQIGIHFSENGHQFALTPIRTASN